MRTFRSRPDTVVLSLVFIVVASLVAPSSPGYAQQQVATRFQYAVKTLCTLAGDVGFGDAFAPGRYRTVINIHNPTERKIEIARKFALAIQPGEAAGEFSITPYKSLTLEPDQAVAYNCFDISSFYCPIRGVCVYTAHPKGGEVSTLDTQAVTGRRMPKTIVIRPEAPLAQPEKRIEMEPFKAVKP